MNWGLYRKRAFEQASTNNAKLTGEFVKLLENFAVRLRSVVRVHTGRRIQHAGICTPEAATSIGFSLMGKRDKTSSERLRTVFAEFDAVERRFEVTAGDDHARHTRVHGTLNHCVGCAHKTTSLATAQAPQVKAMPTSVNVASELGRRDVGTNVHNRRRSHDLGVRSGPSGGGTVARTRTASSRGLIPTAATAAAATSAARASATVAVATARRTACATGRGSLLRASGRRSTRRGCRLGMHACQLRSV